MADGDAAVEAMAQRRVGDVARASAPPGRRVSSTWKSRSSPRSAAQRGRRVERRSSSVGHHVGDAAEHAAVLGDDRRRARRRQASSRTCVDARTSATACSSIRPRQRSRTRRRPARRCRPAAPSESRWVRMRRCHGRRRSGGANSIAPRTSCADQCASRSRADGVERAARRCRRDSARAARCGPCRDGCGGRRSTGRTMPPSRSSRPVAGAAAAGRCGAIASVLDRDDRRATKPVAGRRCSGGRSSTSARPGTRRIGEHEAPARAECAAKACRHQFSRFTALSCQRRRAEGGRQAGRHAEDQRCRSAERSSQRREQARDVAAGTALSTMRKARPEPAPAVPAANSATTAPISARPPAICRPARK